MKDQLSVARDVVILGAILLFASGWMTAFFYLQHFGISLNAMEWPVYAFYLYSLIPLQHAFWTGLGGWLAPVVLVIFAATTFLMWVFPLRRGPVGMAAFVCVMALLIPLSREAAEAEAQCVRYGGGNRSVYLAMETSKMPTDDQRATGEITALRRAVSDSSAILIAETSRHLFVLFQPQVQEARLTGEYRRAPVFRVPIEAIKLARTTAPALPDKSNGFSRGACYDRP